MPSRTATSSTQWHWRPYNGVDKPPYANEDGDNNLRVFQSRSGHRLTFDDTDGEERVELILHNEEIRIIWDSPTKQWACTRARTSSSRPRTPSLKCTDFILEAPEHRCSVRCKHHLVSGVETAVVGGEMTLKPTW